MPERDDINNISNDEGKHREEAGMFYIKIDKKNSNFVLAIGESRNHKIVKSLTIFFYITSSRLILI